MRAIATLTLLLLLGCTPSVGVSSPQPAVTAGGGGGGAATCEIPGAGANCWAEGGGGGDPMDVGDCPVDFRERLTAAIAAVPDRMYRTSLESQWTVIDARSGSSGPSTMEFYVGGFMTQVDYLERRNELSADQAGELRRLVSCYH
jgi:hypothetical protein